jgi:Zn-dependent protease
MSTELEIAEFGILVLSIMLHEVSHGWAALALGDDTAKRAGRLTLNPLKHIDPFGSIVVPAILLLSHSGFIFGWAKPVPVNVGRLRSPRNDAVLTGLAGPAMNLVLVSLAAAIFHVVHPAATDTSWAFNLLFYIGFLNLALAMFNLIPIPPLDGSSVVERLVPTRHINQYYALRPYTMLLVFAFVIITQKSGAYEHFVTALANEWLRIAGYPNVQYG